MAKEKQLKFEREIKDLTFYYEIIGIISMVIPILAFARLGLIGFYIMLIFKIIFGDWYFLFLLAIFVYGLRCLIYHKPMNFKTLRVIGIFLVLLGIMMLSHFPMHKYIMSFDQDGSGGYYSKTLGLYLDYFKNYYDGMVVGGGILGSTFFYLFYSLFSSIGTILMIIIFVFVGVVFFTEKTIKDFLGIFGRWGIIIFKFIKGKFKSFKYDIVIPKAKKSSKSISITELKMPIGIKFEGMEHTKTKELKEKIGRILNNMNIFYNDIDVIIGYNVSTFIINSLQYIDMTRLNDMLKNSIDSSFKIKKDLKTKFTVIEVNNNYDSIYDVRGALESMKEYRNDFVYPIGITSMNERITIDLQKEIGILLEDTNEFSNSFLNAFILMSYIKNTRRKFKIKYLLKNDFDKLIQEANSIIHTLNEANCQSIKEYNEKSDKIKHLPQRIIIMNSIEEFIKTDDEVEKMTFLFQISIKIGFYFIVLTKNKQLIPKLIDNYLTKVIYFKDSINLSVTNNIRLFEAFYVDKDLIERITYTSIEDDEFEKFKNRI